MGLLSLPTCGYSLQATHSEKAQRALDSSILESLGLVTVEQVKQHTISPAKAILQRVLAAACL